MSISKMIRENRKKQNLTQEQVASQLGVSAPAVNKWEKGISYPDITLLAPMARLFKIDLNTLLAFEEELTDLEIGQFINALSEEIMAADYETAFAHAEDKIREYPNCEKLILYAAQILNGFLVMKLQDISKREQYEEKILGWFEKVAFSEQTELAKEAQISLIQNLIRKEKFDEAQKMLDKIPLLGFDKRIAQTQLFEAKGQHEEAYRTLEEMLYQQVNGITSVLLQKINTLCTQKEYQTALRYAALLDKTAELYALGSYQQNSAYLLIYADMKDKEHTLDYMERMFEGFSSVRDAKTAELYSHMKFNEDDGVEKIKGLMLQSIEKDDSLAFIKEELRFKELVKRVQGDEK